MDLINANQEQLKQDSKPAIQSITQSQKKGVKELFNSNPELASIGTLEQYSQYLDTIFPDSKVKDIVYRGAEDTSTRDYLYFTKVKGEAYAFSKANITKSGNITERNPINAINKAAENYFNKLYGKDAFTTLTLPDDFGRIIYESLDLRLLDENYNLTQEGQKEYKRLKTIDSRKKELLRTIDEQDKFLLENIKIVENLYNKIKIESETDLTKPYDDSDYQENINEYNRARKTIDVILSSSNIRENIGVITAALINIKNPYVDEIVQEDLENNRDAFKNGHDGAFLNDGDHFLVKPKQTYELGNKQDTEGFKEFVSKFSAEFNTSNLDFSKLSNPEEFKEYSIHLGENMEGPSLADWEAYNRIMSKDDTLIDSPINKELYEKYLLLCGK
jgi:hypothetical protein